jgi:hypothetical protein
MTNKFFLYVPLVVAASLLSGCDTIRNTLGLDHYQADEMQVDPNPRLASLTIPPNFQLRPPRPGAPNPHQQQADESAREVLMGSKDATIDATMPPAKPAKKKTVKAVAKVSNAEAKVLDTATAQAGVSDDTTIRDTVDAEVVEKKKGG